MNQKKLFNEKSLGEALVYVLSTEEQYPSLVNFKKSNDSKPYKTEENVWKTLSWYIINKQDRKIHRFTSQKYAFNC